MTTTLAAYRRNPEAYILPTASESIQVGDSITCDLKTFNVRRATPQDIVLRSMAFEDYEIGDGVIYRIARFADDAIEDDRILVHHVQPELTQDRRRFSERYGHRKAGA